MDDTWLVVAGLTVYWAIMLGRAMLARAAPWYYKGFTVSAYPMAIAAIFIPRYEIPLGSTFAVLVVIGFFVDFLWTRTEVLGRYDDLMRKRAERSRPRHLRSKAADDPDASDHMPVQDR